MELVYALEETPEILTKSIFLVGPTPREESVSSWRPGMIEALKNAGYDGTVFVPEPREGTWQGDYQEQANWEQTHLNLCDAIVAWVPRNLEDMPAFTTNVEFGRYVGSRKVFYGRPPEAPHTSYLDWLYDSECGRTPSSSVEELAESVSAALKGREQKRTGGERFVPLQVWETEMFQQWYQSHRASGNRLDGATVLWTFYPDPKFLLAFVLRVNLRVAAENRNKSNEFIFSRRNISSVLPIWKHPGGSIKKSKVVLIREFRSPVQNGDSMIRELPSGSEANKDADLALEVAAAELKQETGLSIPGNRFSIVKSRQICGTLSTHRSYLFVAQLSDEEIQQAEETARHGGALGNEVESERTYVEVRTIGDLLKSSDVDYATLGMMMDGLALLEEVD